MTIETEIIHTLATVEVAEDYRVVVTTSDLDTALTWTQTEQLIAELRDALEDARRMLAEDFPVLDPATAAQVRAVHAFDIAPLCRDCSEGKHSACIGSAFVERGPDVDEVECTCDKSGHPPIIGGPR